MAALQVPTAEPHYAHRQAISLHELRARMADAITDWLGGRALHMHFGAIFFLLPVCGPFWVPSKAPFGCKRHVKGTWRYSHFPDAMASPRCS